MNTITKAVLTGIVRIIDERKVTDIPTRDDWSFEGARAYREAVSNRQLADQDITPVDLERFLGVVPTSPCTTLFVKVLSF